jgi:hypothetical protein
MPDVRETQITKDVIEDTLRDCYEPDGQLSLDGCDQLANLLSSLAQQSDPKSKLFVKSSQREDQRVVLPVVYSFLQDGTLLQKLTERARWAEAEVKSLWNRIDEARTILTPMSDQTISL